MKTWKDFSHSLIISQTNVGECISLAWDNFVHILRKLQRETKETRNRPKRVKSSETRDKRRRGKKEELKSIEEEREMPIARVSGLQLFRDVVSLYLHRLEFLV